MTRSTPTSFLFSWLAATPWHAKKLQVGSIGLEIALEQFHLVQLQSLNGCLALRAAHSEPLLGSFEENLKDSRNFRAALKSALKRSGFSGRRVVTSMPASMTQVLSVNYEIKNGQSDGDAIMRLLMDRIGDDLADFVVDYMPIHSDHRTVERAALIAMCRKDTVHAYLELLSDCGLEPSALEIGPVAIKRLVDTIDLAHKPGSALVVNCGREKSFLTLISKRQLLSDDEVEFGERTVVARLCQALEVETHVAQQLLVDANVGEDRPDENTRTLIEIVRPELNVLAQEIERGLIYAKSENRGDSETAIYLMGSIARWRGMDRLLSNILRHQVLTIPDPLGTFVAPNATSSSCAATDTRQAHPELAVAAGLALRDFRDD